MRSGAPGIPFIPGLAPPPGAGALPPPPGAPQSGPGVVVVGLVGKNEEDLSQLLDRVLDHRLFRGIISPPDFNRRDSASSSANPDPKHVSWLKSRLKHYHDEERGILYVMFAWGSLPMQLLKDDENSSSNLPQLLEQYESLGLRGLLLMFSVCHVILMVQDGAKFDPKLLRVFRVLQAAKASMAPTFKSPLKGAPPARGFYTGSSPGRTPRQAPMLSLMSGFSHTLFPGQCTPVLLFVCMDDFSETDGPDSPVKQQHLSRAAIAVRPITKLELSSSRRKFQSSVEAQVRFLIKKCRTVLGFGDSGHGMGSGMIRGAGTGAGPALFTMDTSRVVLFVDRSPDALESTIGVLENMVKGNLSLESGLWGPGPGSTEDIQAVREFIWRQAELIRGRGGSGAMPVGVGMVAAAAAAAAASAGAGSMGGTLRPISNPPELPSLPSWLGACNMIASSLMKIEFKSLEENELLSSRYDGAPRRRSSSSSSPAEFSSKETDLSCLESGMDINMKFSVSWCKKVFPSARAVYLKGLSACYPSVVHKHQLERALSAFRSMVRGPAVNIFLEKLRNECESIWRSGRQQCDAVSLTGRPCMHHVHNSPGLPENPDWNLEKPHCSGVVYLSSCDCGRSRRLRDDPFDYESANLSFFQFPGCEETLQSVVLPHSTGSAGCPWSLVRLGSSKYYQASSGLQQGGFCSEQNYLSHYDIPLVYKSEEGSRAKGSNDQGFFNSGKANKKLFQEVKTKMAPEKQKPPVEVKLNYNEESAFPPLPQKNDPKKPAPKKGSKQPEVKKPEQPKEIVENGPGNPRSPFKNRFTDGVEVGLFIGFEHECPRGHRFFLTLEHLQKLGPPYSQQAGVEKKHRRVRTKRSPNPERQFPVQVMKSSSEKLQDGVAGSLLEFTSAMENLSFGPAAGDGRVLADSDLPIFMECPHCKTYTGKDGEPNYAGSISRLQRIFMVTPPFPLLMASCPVVQFDETSTAPGAKGSLRFSWDCEVVLPPDSFLSLRLPFVYCAENADGSLSPLVCNEDHPEHTAWLAKGTAFYILSATPAATAAATTTASASAKQ